MFVNKNDKKIKNIIVLFVFLVYNYSSIVYGVVYMDAVIIIVIITLVFSVTIGLIIMNRDDVPDVLIEEYDEALENRRKELKEEDKINKDILEKDIEVVITKDDKVDDDEIV